MLLFTGARGHMCGTASSGQFNQVVHVRSDNLNHRVMLLLDSQVVCAIISKGRTSSRRLQYSLRVLDALCLAGGLVLTFALVDTGNNPSDIPSRWFDNALRDDVRK